MKPSDSSQSNLTTNTPDDSTPRPSVDSQSEYTSPSKSIRNFFRNRTSTYSIESISEEPELRKQRRSIESLSPTRLALLRPKFGRSRSSVLDEPVVEEEKIAKGEVTVDDFADTSSDEDHASIHEVEGISTQHFVFKEEFDEEDNKNRNILPRPVLRFTPSIDVKLANAGITRETIDEEEEERKEERKRGEIRAVESSSREGSGTPPPRRDIRGVEEPRLMASMSPIISPTSPPQRLISVDSNTSIRAPNSAQDSGSSSRKSMPLGSPLTYNSNRTSSTSDELRYPEPNLSNGPTPFPTPRRITRQGSTKKKEKDSVRDSASTGKESLSLKERESTGKDSQRDTASSGKDNLSFGNSVSFGLDLSGLQMINTSGVSVAPTAAPLNPPSKQRTARREDNPRLSAVETVGSSGYHSSLIDPEETAMYIHRDSLRSSMSSGELLSKLVPEKTQETDEGANIRSPVENFTAHMDSTSEFPMMLFKVQDKDYDEGRQRWSVYENRASKEGVFHPNENIVEPQTAQLVSHKPHGSDSSDSSLDNSFTQKVSRKGSSREASGKGSYRVGSDYNKNRESDTFASPTDDQSSQPPSHLIAVQPITSHIGLPPLSPLEPVARYGSSSPYMDFRHEKPRSIRKKDSKNSLSSPATAYMSNKRYPINEDANDLLDFDLEKNPEEDYGINISTHSVLQFSVMMVLGLLVPPVYFLLAFGMFDSNYGSNQQYYTGLQYYSRSADGKISVKRYSKIQKIVAITTGISWVLVILAMIGVGFGVGLTRLS